MVDTVPEDLTYEVEYEGFLVRLLEGWGNRFYVVLVAQSELDLGQTVFADERVRARLAKRWCSGSPVEIHGHAIPPGDDESGRGVDDAADGLIFGLYREHRDGGIELGSRDQVADAQMVLHNADGSPAEMSGNGIRCLAHSLALLAGIQGLRRAAAAIAAPASPKDDTWRSVTIRFHTGAGPRSVRLLSQPTDDLQSPNPAGLDDDRRSLTSVAAMGEVLAGPKPTAEQKRIAEVELQALNSATRSVGNPHFVLHVPPSGERDVATANRKVLDKWGPALARSSEPAQAINVEFISTNPTAVDVRTEPEGPDYPFLAHARRNRLFMLVWERGVGPTLACGTGAVAAAERAAAWRLVDPKRPIYVWMSEEGCATVHLHGESASLQGPTTRLRFRGSTVRHDLEELRGSP